MSEVAVPVDPGSYVDIQHFYARQMQLLDDGRTEEWAATFSEDGVFSAGPQLAEGRENIARASGQVTAQYDKEGVQRRHWLGMLTAVQKGDEVRTRCYALVIEVPQTGKVDVHRSTVCDDVLVRSGGTWLVDHRTVTRDGLD